MQVSQDTFIRTLDPTTILKIAAGEVIERPSCIVKELIENAVDAGATRIEIHIKNGGMDEISVSDDGCGILQSEIPLAVSPHATSKLRQLEDLDHMSTLGFRGEALASIASIAELDLYSRPLQQEIGSHLRVKFGVTQFQKPYPMPKGTTITIGSLFLNVPARKKFLKTAGTEKQHIERMIQRMALHHRYISWKFSVDDGQVVFELERSDGMKQRIQQIYGETLSSHLLEVRGDYGEVHVSGLISDKDLHFSRAQEMWLYVNGRAVQDRLVQSAVMEGYRTALMERRYPFALIHVELPPQNVDVNIHPRKSEVRFRDTQHVYRAVSESVRKALHKQNSAPQTLPLVMQQQMQPLELLFSTDARTNEMAAETLQTYETSTKQSTPQGLFSALSHLGTIDDTYLLLTDALSLYVVDQHAAHERVLFEKLRHRDRSSVQRYLVPPILEVAPDKEPLLKNNLTTLEGIGFELEHFGARSYLVRSAPEFIKTQDPKLILHDILEDAALSESSRSWENLKDDFFSRVACHSAVRAHDKLHRDEVRALLVDMDQTHLSSYCPHGRPTFLRFAVSDLEKLFRRT